VSFPPRP
jgi:Ca2+-binding RTX toxin-like protein